MLIDVTNSVTEWIFPRKCFVCNVDVEHGNLCVHCQSFCHACPQALIYTNNVNAIFYYELTIKKIIRGAKFNKNSCLLHLLFRLVHEEIIRSRLIEALKEFAPNAVTFVPSHWLNRIARGVELPFIFARLLADQLGVPLITLLSRRHFLRRQTLLQRKSERKALIVGSFVLKRSTKTFERLVLVDDLVTTGATFDESKKMLKEICNNIRCIAIAKTP